MLKKLPLFLVGILSCSLAAQDSVVAKLTHYGKNTLTEPAYADRKAAQDTFLTTLKNYISSREGFEDPLKPVTNMMRLPLGKDAAIYSWQMPDSNFQYRRYGLVAAIVKGEVVISELRDQEIPMAQFKRLKPEEWYGAIYYQVIPLKKGRDELYTLLGFRSGDRINQKIIDVIEIDRRGRPRFGDKIFRVDQFMDKTLRRAPMRLILSYGADISASVKWNQEEEMIIMDHLSPPTDKMNGMYEAYGPDMSYDALRWDGDWWLLEEEVKFNSRQNVPIIPPNKPTDLPPRR